MQALWKKSPRWFVVIILITANFHFSTLAQDTGKQLLPNSVPPVLPQLAPIGRMPEQTTLHLAIGLPMRNKDNFEHELRDMYDPKSPNYRHYLGREQFNEEFSPSQADYDAVKSFFQSNGFALTSEYHHRLVLGVSGTVADIERVFHVTLRNYRHPYENRTFFSADTTPSLDLDVPLLHVSGLNNFSVLKSQIAFKSILGKALNLPHQTGSGPDGTYMGSDFRDAYLPGVSLTGTGQTLGLLEFDTYYPNDITTYENLAGLPDLTPTIVPVEGGVSSPGSGNVEVALDIEIALAIAPGLSKIVVYEAPNNTAYFDDVLAAMADDTSNSPEEFSCSWGESSPSSPDETAEGLFQTMASHHQSFFNAAGDSDAFNNGIPFPSESTNITQVGGTTLTTTGPGGARVEETVWNWGGNPGGTTSIGTCGGISKNFSIPYWQQGISMAANEGSNNMRNVPDVSMTADNVYVVADNGFGGYVGGTSCAAPSWAAFIALVNQQALAGGATNVGFINPAVYAIGKSASYSSDFNDIVAGNNFWDSSTNKFPAVPGYDLCTGWGTPGGDDLIDALAGVSDSLAVTPGRGFVASGPAGGPFTVSSLNYTATNSGANPLNWSLVNPSSWLAVSACGGTLTPGGPATNVVVSLNPSAYSLPAGTYTAGIVFTNQTTGASRTRQFTLLIGQSSIQNGDFGIATLSSWAQTGGIGVGTGHHPAHYPTYNYDFVDSNGFESSILPYTGTYCDVFGTYGVVGYISQLVPTVPGQSYELSFWFTSKASGSTQQFIVNWNTNTATTNTILNLVNPAAFGWTYTNFLLTATSTNALLQFGARDDPSWFGLDDVSLVPVPTPNISSVFPAGPNGLALSWNTQTGLVYQVQYSTNLLSSNWFNLETNVATGPILTVTNGIGTNPFLFYRVLRAP